MRVELQNKLFEKYPKLFTQKDLSMQQTCMCWGIEVGDGWYWLLDNLCEAIQDYVENNDEPQPELIQVKEKFGGLRFYLTNVNSHIHGMVVFAEYMSYKICENCGSAENITQTKGWIRTVCKNCLEGKTNK